jgi:hypothetical protein
MNQINQINRMDQTNQITRQTGLVPDVQVIGVLPRRNGFAAVC